MKFSFKMLLISALFAACQNEAPKPPVTEGPVEATAILSHKYWVSKPFNDALFAKTVMDTLFAVPCSEIIFTTKDSFLFTACLSDAGRGTYKSLSANSIEMHLEGFENDKIIATCDEKTGIMHLAIPGDATGWQTDFIPQDAVNTTDIDEITINLGRKRLAGTYSRLPQKGEAAVASVLELRPDGTQSGLGDFDKYEPWPSGDGGGFILDPYRNVMYLVKKVSEEEALTAVGWQLSGDTLRLWDTKNAAPEGDMPEYKITKLKGAFLKVK